MDRTEFEQNLRDLVVYTLPKKCRKEKDIVDFYVDCYLLAFKDYKKLKTK